MPDCGWKHGRWWELPSIRLDGEPRKAKLHNLAGLTVCELNSQIFHYAMESIGRLHLQPDVGCDSEN